MNKATDPVLEFLDEKDIAVPIGVLDNNLDVSYATIDRALEGMLEKGFIERDDDYTSHYKITERGRGYLEGDVDGRDY